MVPIIILKFNFLSILSFFHPHNPTSSIPSPFTTFLFSSFSLFTVIFFFFLPLFHTFLYLHSQFLLYFSIEQDIPYRVFKELKKSDSQRGYGVYSTGRLFTLLCIVLFQYSIRLYLHISAVCTGTRCSVTM